MFLLRACGDANLWVMHAKILTPIFIFPIVLLGLEDFAKVSQSIVLVVEFDILKILDHTTCTWLNITFYFPKFKQDIWK